MRLLVELVLLLVTITSINDVVHARTNQWLVSITSVSSNQALLGGTREGTPRLRVPSARVGDNDHQWIIQDLGLGGGIVSIRSVGSGFYLNGRATGMQEPVLLAADMPLKDDKFLQWVLIDAGQGRVALQSVSSKGYLDGRHPLMERPLLVRETAKPKEDSCQQWVITSLQPTARLVSIQSLSSKQYLDGRDVTSDLRVQLAPDSRDPGVDLYLQWIVTQHDGNVYSFKSVSSGYYLDGRSPDLQEPWLSSPTRTPSVDKYLQWYLLYFRLASGSVDLMMSASSFRWLNGRTPGIHDPLLSTSPPPPELVINNQLLHWTIADLTTTEALPTQP